MPVAHPTGGILSLGAAGPGQGMTQITPSDTGNVSIQGFPRSLYTVEAGNLHIICLDGTEVTFAVPANFLLPVAVQKVFALNTTVTTIFAIW